MSSRRRRLELGEAFIEGFRRDRPLEGEALDVGMGVVGHDRNP